MCSPQLICAAAVLETRKHHCWQITRLTAGPAAGMHPQEELTPTHASHLDSPRPSPRVHTQELCALGGAWAWGPPS